METRSKGRTGVLVVTVAVLVALAAGVLTAVGDGDERALTLAAAWGDGTGPGGVAKLEWAIAHERWTWVGSGGHFERIVRARVGDTVHFAVDPKDGTMPSCSIRGGLNSADGTTMCTIGIVK